MKNSFSFEKKEHVVSQKLIDELFTGGNSQSVAAFPLRVVYMVKPLNAPLGSDTSLIEERPAPQVLLSVSKKRLHHAVDRNHAKRQLREAYRLNKHVLNGLLPADSQLVMAFIWLTDTPQPTDIIAARMKTLLHRVGKKLNTKDI